LRARPIAPLQESDTEGDERNPAMSFHPLRLENCEIKPLHHNRRECVRHAAQGSAVAITNLAERRIVTTTQLIDASPSGLGLISPMELPIGANIRLHFNNSEIAGRSGTVVRCHPAEGGYRVGVFCDACVCAA
jgi:hypothetical protein